MDQCTNGHAPSDLQQRRIASIVRLEIDTAETDTRIAVVIVCGEIYQALVAGTCDHAVNEGGRECTIANVALHVVNPFPSRVNLADAERTVLAVVDVSRRTLFDDGVGTVFEVVPESGSRAFSRVNGNRNWGPTG